MVTRPIVVTGCGGFVGSALLPKIGAAFEGVPIVPLVRERHIRADDISLDLADEAATLALMARLRPRCIVHLAAHASVGLAHKRPGGVWHDNRDASYSLAKAVAATVPDATVLVSSTSEVYGEAFQDGPVDETTLPRPRGPYATSKLAGEQAFEAVLPASAQLIICRPVNHTGRGQVENFVIPSLAAQVVRSENGLAPPIIEVGNLAARRDFLDVADVIDAYIALLKRARDLPRRTILNVASGRTIAIREILDFFLAQARRPIEERVDKARLRPNDIPSVEVGTDRLAELIAWPPERPLEATLLEVLDDKRRSLGGRQAAC